MLQKDGSLWTGCFNLVKQPLALLIIGKIACEFKEAWYLPSGGGSAVCFLQIVNGAPIFILTITIGMSICLYIPPTAQRTSRATWWSGGGCSKITQ